MTLSALQADFRDWLAAGSEQAAARFAPDAQAGLLVYQNNYRAALLACLDESFPRTAQWLGTAEFHASAARFVDATPPGSWSLDHYAADFPRRLADQWADDPEAGELAALELALADAFVGPDAVAMGAAALGQVDWDEAVLTAVPTARLLVLETNAPAIWSALVAGANAPLPARMPSAATVLVWRQAEVACFRTLGPLEADIVGRMLGGVTFSEVCALLVAACGEADGVQTAGQWLGRWVADGLVDQRV